MSSTLRPHDGVMLVTHANCLDGTGCALVFLRAGGRRDRIIFRGPKDLILGPYDVPSDVTEVWYADCCPLDIRDPARGRPFRVFDHHVSNLRSLGETGGDLVIFDMTRCGTSLLASHIIDDDASEVSGIIAAIESYDLGRFDDRLGQRLADIAASLPQEELLRVMHGMGDAILTDTHWGCLADGVAAVRRTYVDALASHIHHTTMSYPGRYGNSRTLCVGIASSPSDWKNSVGERILESCDLAVIVDVMTGNVSLRSRQDGPDCSVIAGLYGGGGHARAAAFRIRGKQLMSLLEEAIFE